jgi:hypothetical protein
MSNVNYRNGLNFEDTVRQELEKKGFTLSNNPSHRTYVKPDLKTGKGKSDIIILKDDLPYMRIECKFINVHGSVVEKNYYPFVCLHNGYFHEDYIVLILGGRWNELFPNHIEKLKEYSGMTYLMTGRVLHVIDYESGDFDTFFDGLKEGYHG